MASQRKPCDEGTARGQSRRWVNSLWPHKRLPPNVVTDRPPRVHSRPSGSTLGWARASGLADGRLAQGGLAWHGWSLPAASRPLLGWPGLPLVVVAGFQGVCRA